MEKACTTVKNAYSYGIKLQPHVIFLKYAWWPVTFSLCFFPGLHIKPRISWKFEVKIDDCLFFTKNPGLPLKSYCSAEGF